MKHTEISAAEKDAMDLMDLIERLRDVSELEDIDHDICDTAREAAREIEELREALISTSLPLYDEVEKLENKVFLPPDSDNF